MVKVLCKGGPYYWIREPRTDFEKKMWAADSAEGLRERIALGWVKELGDFNKKIFADEPVPPPTKEERKRWKREYPDKYFLLPAEIYPRDETDPPCPLETALNNMTHMTFYGAAPHRPNPQAELAVAEAAANRRRRRR